jgi:hypothetical protein
MAEPASSGFVAIYSLIAVVIGGANTASPQLLQVGTFFSPATCKAAGNALYMKPLATLGATYICVQTNDEKIITTPAAK